MTTRTMKYDYYAYLVQLNKKHDCSYAYKKSHIDCCNNQNDFLFRISLSGLTEIILALFGKENPYLMKFIFLGDVI